MRNLASAAMLVAALCAAGSAENITLTIYHTSDIHGWIMSRAAVWNKEDPKRVAGGFAALSSLVRATRGQKLLFDSGDWFQGTPEGALSRGQSVVDLFNAAGFDAVLVGNHDFDYGQERLRELVTALKMPALGANIRDAKTHARVAWLSPPLIKKISGVRVGIFGLTYPDMKSMAFAKNIEGLEFTRAVDEARLAVEELRKKGATVVIALTHLGFESPEMGQFEGDQTLAREVPGIDVIMGGHTHKFIKEPPRVNGALITEPGIGLTAVDKVTLEIDPKTKRAVSSKGELVNLWIDRTGEDPGILKTVRADQAEADRVFSMVIATAAETLDRSRDSESAMGDWFTDCVRAWSGADIGFTNGASIRGGIPVGPVTLRTIYNIMPYDNRMVKLTMTGAQIQETIDHGAGLGWEMLQESGAEFSYNRGRPEGRRISKLEIGGKTVDPTASYTLATNDFIVKGGESFTSFSRAKQEFSDELVRDVIRRCAEKDRLIKAPPRGRMISLEDNGGTEKRAR